MSTTKGIDTKVVAAAVSSATKETDTKTVVLRVLFYLLVVAIIVFNLFPFVWALLSSFRPSSELFSTKLLPTQLTLAHFQAVFKDARFVAGLINSLHAARFTVLIALGPWRFFAYVVACPPLSFLQPDPV